MSRTDLTSALEAMGAIMRRDFLIFISYRMMFLTRIFGAFFSLALFYYLSRLVRVESFATPGDYFAFAVVGMIISETLQSTVGVATSLRGELVAGTFERLVLSPLGAVAGVISMMLFPFVDALVSAVILLLFGTFVFGLDIHWSTAVLALPFAAVGTAAFAAFGMFFAASTVLFKQAVGGVAFLTAIVAFVSGLLFPIELLPSWIQSISRVQPFSAAVDLLRYALVGRPLPSPMWQELARIGAFVVIGAPVAVLILRSAVGAAQRRGSIIEY